MDGPKRSLLGPSPFEGRAAHGHLRVTDFNQADRRSPVAIPLTIPV